MIAGLLLTALLGIVTPESDTISTPAVVSAVKMNTRLDQTPAPTTAVLYPELDQYGIKSLKGMQSLVPGLHIPEYGSSMTSSIYLRGLGSRMENPVMGLYIDDIPLLDKNCYDFDFIDYRSALMLRGPQGTSYGRNAMGGVLSLNTLSASDASGVRAELEAGSAGLLRLRGGYYQGRNALTVGYRQLNGYFDNRARNEKADPYHGASFRWRYDAPSDARKHLTHILHLGFSDEGGFAYGLYRDGQVEAVNYNDPSRYRRFFMLDGTKLQIQGERLHWALVASLQALADRMLMDQDYTPDAMFTLEQKQRSGAGTFEVIVRPRSSSVHWKPQTGAFCFFKANRMLAPVTFKEDGIQRLILDHANAGIPDEFGALEIEERSFPVSSDFDILSWNTALYHESQWLLGHWQFTAGIRWDYEGGWMRYDCNAPIHYRLYPLMTAFRAFRTTYQGDIGHAAWEVLPKFSILYSFSGTGGSGSSFLTLSKGYRAGGFNTQIFSDILQNKMMSDVMGDMGVHFVTPRVAVTANHTEYDPEEAWNLEWGWKYASSRGWRLETSLYYIDCRHQQLTVFPPGQSTGRMMTNAGHSQSYGAEVEGMYRKGRFSSHVSLAWNQARFLDYRDGSLSYRGKRIPYTPEWLLFGGVNYRQPLDRGCLEALEMSADLRGTGPIFWNEDNSLRQAFYALADARISLVFPHFRIYVRGENLSDHSYQTFYFKSVGNSFMQRSRPRTAYIGIQIHLL